MQRFQHMFLAMALVTGLAACTNISVGDITPPPDHKPITTVPTDRDVIYTLKVKGVD